MERNHMDISEAEWNADRPNEECGVFGIYNHKEAAAVTYFALMALQHRGQEAAGITTVHDGKMHSHKGLGLLTDVFAKGEVNTLAGNLAIGHVRYSTAGANTYQNAQPITVSTHEGNMAIAHNGNLVNAKSLRVQLERQGSLFQTTSDTEVIAHLVARAKYSGLLSAVMAGLQAIVGGYALLILSDKELIAVRDPLGLRPLSLGRLGSAYVLASESCAFETVGATFIRDIEPGELVNISEAGIESHRIAPVGEKRMCTFEHVYFARPDSDIDGWNVHAVRKRLGKILAEKHPVDADIVIGVPDSSISAAAGYAEASGIPFEMGLVKNKYIARTFIQPSQELRDAGVRMKLNAVRSVVDGKRVILIDDSIVRGTTIKRIVRLLRDAGASEVHLRISSPPYRHPCHYGIDTATADQLIAANLSVEEICETAEADSLEYMTVEELMQGFGYEEGAPEGVHAAGSQASLSKSKYPFCNACFTGRYPTDLKDEMEAAEKRFRKEVGVNV